MNLISISCIDLYLIEKVFPAKFFSIHTVHKSGLKLNSDVVENIGLKFFFHCYYEKRFFNPMFSTTSATS